MYRYIRSPNYLGEVMNLLLVRPLGQRRGAMPSVILALAPVAHPAVRLVQCLRHPHHHEGKADGAVGPWRDVHGVGIRSGRATKRARTALFPSSSSCISSRRRKTSNQWYSVLILPVFLHMHVDSHSAGRCADDSSKSVRKRAHSSSF